MNVIQQGETFTFDFELSGEDLEGMTATMDVLQYPGDTPAISRALILQENGKFVGTLTSAETTGLAIGQWFIHATTSDADENIRDIIKLYVTKAWV